MCEHNETKKEQNGICIYILVLSQKNGILGVQTNGKNKWITQLHTEAKANPVDLLSQIRVKIFEGLDIIRLEEYMVSIYRQ